MNLNSRKKGALIIKGFLGNLEQDNLVQGFLVLLVGELGANLFDQRAGRKADRREGYGGLFGCGFGNHMYYYSPNSVKGVIEGFYRGLL